MFPIRRLVPRLTCLATALTLSPAAATAEPQIVAHYTGAGYEMWMTHDPALPDGQQDMAFHLHVTDPAACDRAPFAEFVDGAVPALCRAASPRYTMRAERRADTQRTDTYLAFGWTPQPLPGRMVDPSASGAPDHTIGLTDFESEAIDRTLMAAPAPPPGSVAAAEMSTPAPSGAPDADPMQDFALRLDKDPERASLLLLPPNDDDLFPVTLTVNAFPDRGYDADADRCYAGLGNGHTWERLCELATKNRTSERFEGQLEMRGDGSLFGRVDNGLGFPLDLQIVQVAEGQYDVTALWPEARPGERSEGVQRFVTGPAPDVTPAPVRTQEAVTPVASTAGEVALRLDKDPERAALQIMSSDAESLTPVVLDVFSYPDRPYAEERDRCSASLGNGYTWGRLCELTTKNETSYRFEGRLARRDDGRLFGRLENPVTFSIDLEIADAGNGEYDVTALWPRPVGDEGPEGVQRFVAGHSPTPTPAPLAR